MRRAGLSETLVTKGSATKMYMINFHQTFTYNSRICIVLLTLIRRIFQLSHVDKTTSIYRKIIELCTKVQKCLDYKIVCISKAKMIFTSANNIYVKSNDWNNPVCRMHFMLRKKIK